MSYSNVDNSEDIRVKIYYDYYLKAKYAAEMMGLDVVINDEHEAKTITIDNFKLILTEDVVLIFVDGKRVFYFDPEDMEIESIDGGWMRLVRILYHTAVDVEEEKKVKTKKPIK